MKDFTVNVVPNEEGGKIPVYLAGQIMVDIQQILMDIGEYLTARELRIQNSMKQDLLSRFLLYMGSDGSISMDTSFALPEITEFGNLVDDAMDLTQMTLEALGSGVGGYWVDDHIQDPFYKKHIVYDVVALNNHLASFPECSLMFGPSDNPKKFGQVDMEKMASYIREKGNMGAGATIGVISVIPSKSKGPRINLLRGEDRVRLSFADQQSEKAALALDGKPVMIGGMLIIDNDGKLVEIRDAGGITEAKEIQFRRLVASNGDVMLKNQVKAELSMSDGKWTLKNADTGVSVTHESWDSAVQAFHDQMVFLFTEYMDESKQLEGEEAEIRDYLRSLIA